MGDCLQGMVAGSCGLNNEAQASRCNQFLSHSARSTWRLTTQAPACPLVYPSNCSTPPPVLFVRSALLHYSTNGGGFACSNAASRRGNAAAPSAYLRCSKRTVTQQSVQIARTGAAGREALERCTRWFSTTVQRLTAGRWFSPAGSASLRCNEHGHTTAHADDEEQ